MAQALLCKDCGTVGVPRVVTPGSWKITFLLLLCIVLPGVVYSIWRRSARYRVCPHCGGRNIIPTSTPLGQVMISSNPGIAASLNAEEQRQEDMRVGAFAVFGLVALIALISWIRISVQQSGWHGVMPVVLSALILGVIGFLWYRGKRML